MSDATCKCMRDLCKGETERDVRSTYYSYEVYAANLYLG